MAGSSVDKLDILAIIGLVLLNVGLAAIWLPLAPTVTGVLILCGVVFAARNHRTEARHGTTDQPGGTGAES
jgi:uncharacterized membrane protein YbaN (DUF454 family)